MRGNGALGGAAFSQSVSQASWGHANLRAAFSTWRSFTSSRESGIRTRTSKGKRKRKDTYERPRRDASTASCLSLLVIVIFHYRMTFELGASVVWRRLSRRGVARASSGAARIVDSDCGKVPKVLAQNLCLVGATCDCEWAFLFLFLFPFSFESCRVEAVVLLARVCRSAKVGELPFCATASVMPAPSLW